MNIKLAALSGLAALGIAQSANAEVNILSSQDSQFTFPRCVANICVREVKVYQQNIEEYIPATMKWGDYNAGGSKIPAHWDKYDRAVVTANVSFPRCDNQYHLEGYLTITYRDGAAYITRSHTIQRSDEDTTRDLTWVLRGYYGVPANGQVNITGASTCRYHGVNGSGWPF